MKSRIARPGIFSAKALLLAAGLLAGCSSGGTDSCNDVSIDICDALNECGLLERTFTSTDQCVASFNGLWEVGNRDDARCRAEWDLVEDSGCSQIAAHFQL